MSRKLVNWERKGNFKFHFWLSFTSSCKYRYWGECDNNVFSKYI